MAATIYLFEDDPDLRELLVEVLQTDLEAQVVVCKSVPELLELGRVSPPDMIVADFWGASQLTLADAERQQIAALGQVAPTVLVSARQWAMDAGPTELGLAAVVNKPLDVESFVSQLRRMLASSDAGLTAGEIAEEGTTDLPRRDALSVLLLPWAHGPS